MADTVEHPGFMLKRDMTRYDLSVSDIATSFGMSRSTIHTLIVGKKSISVEMSQKLGLLFHCGPHHWLNRQIDYDISQSKSVEIVPLLKQVLFRCPGCDYIMDSEEVKLAEFVVCPKCKDFSLNEFSFTLERINSCPNLEKTNANVFVDQLTELYECFDSECNFLYDMLYKYERCQRNEKD